MKKDTHPDGYRKVIFRDNASGERFLFGSVVETTEVAKWEDGKEYPLSQVEISSASHPFYTGKETVIDIAGRVDKFKRRVAIAKDTKSSKNVKKDKMGKKTKNLSRNL
jgi:large subunit ribosomal protein L31